MNEPIVTVPWEQMFAIAADELLRARIELRITQTQLQQANQKLAELEKGKEANA